MVVGLGVCLTARPAEPLAQAPTQEQDSSSTAPRKKKARRATSSARGSEPRPLGEEKALGFVDAHLHLNDVAMALELMEERSIERAVVFWGRNSDNALLAEAARRDPSKFIPFYSVSPERKSYRSAWEARDLSLLDQVDAALSTGVFAGIGELSVTHFPGRGFPEANYGPLHPLSVGLFELAAKHEVPVNVHCEITDLKEMDELLKRFPDVTVIWAHGGYTPCFLAERWIRRHPNLVYELSARTWRHHPRSPEYTIYADEQNVWPQWLALIEAHPTRFVVGTDASLHSMERSLEQVDGVQRLLEQLSPATRQLVAQDNLLRVLRASK